MIQGNIIVIIIITATQLQMRRDLAAKGHDQSHISGEKPCWYCLQALLLLSPRGGEN